MKTGPLTTLTLDMPLPLNRRVCAEIYIETVETADGTRRLYTESMLELA